MSMQFSNSTEAVKYFAEHDVKDYLIGVDNDRHIVAKEKNWFNTSWLGRKIDQWKGNQFDAGAFFEATKQIFELANPKLGEASRQDEKVINDAKGLQTALLTTVGTDDTKIGDYGKMMTKYFMSMLAPEKAAELKSAAAKEKEIPKWPDPVQIWEDLLGGREHREKEVPLEIALHYLEPKPFNPAALFAEEEAKPSYFGVHKGLFDTIENLREKAFQGKPLTKKETALIQEFYTMRNDFIKGWNEKFEKRGKEIEADYDVKLKEKLAQLPANPTESQITAAVKQVQIARELDPNLLFYHELDKINIALGDLENKSTTDAYF